MQRVQALDDISRSAPYAFAVHKAVHVCCHSNETRAPIVNTPFHYWPPYCV